MQSTRPSLLLLLATAVALLGRVRGVDAETTEPPAIDNLRYIEDYGYLRGAEPTDELWPWTPLKYIPLNAAGDVYLTLGSEFRLRYERYENDNWGEGPQDSNGYLWSRALPYVDLHLGRNVRVFGQLISAFVHDLDQPISPVDENRIDALQAFVDVRLPLIVGHESALTFRVGRQLFTYGSGRLIDVRYGPNILQSFDAAKAVFQADPWQLDAFYARPVDHHGGEFDDDTNDRQAIWSLYGTLKAGRIPLGVDLYYIGYLNKDAVFAEQTGRELRHTLGTRLFGHASGWDWDLEFFYQFGEFSTNRGDGSISAWSASSNTGYTFESLPLQPRLGLKANIVSGDDDPDDRDVQTFNPLFPKGKYFGKLTPLGPINLIHINPSVALKLTDKLLLTGNVAFYWRESERDGIYAMGGTRVLRTAGTSDARFITTQFEALLEYQVDRHLSLGAALSTFTAGDFIKDTGAGKPIRFISLEATYRF